jgi:hypothetical protein
LKYFNFVAGEAERNQAGLPTCPITVSPSAPVAHPVSSEARIRLMTVSDFFISTPVIEDLLKFQIILTVINLKIKW